MQIIVENVVILQLYIKIRILLLCFIMQYKSIKITFPNGRIKTYPFTAFEHYAPTNELEHKDGNIIISLDNTSKSFVYETDDLSNEMVNKEYISIVFID